MDFDLHCQFTITDDAGQDAKVIIEDGSIEFVDVMGGRSVSICTDNAIRQIYDGLGQYIEATRRVKGEEAQPSPQTGEDLVQFYVENATEQWLIQAREILSCALERIQQTEAAE